MEGKYCPECRRHYLVAQAVCVCGRSMSDKASANPKVPPFKSPGSSTRFDAVHLRMIGLGVFAVLGVATSLALFNFSGSSTVEDHRKSDTLPTAAIENNNTDPAGSPNTGDTFDGVVTKVFTGDAIAVRDQSNTEHQVRLHDIVAPKLNENYGKEAKEGLSASVLGKSVHVVPLRVDESGLIYGRVTRDGNNIALEQIRSGLASHNDLIEQPQDERKLYAEAEASAKAAGLGMWGMLELTRTPPGAELVSTNDANSPSSRPDTLTAPNGELPYRLTTGPLQQKSEIQNEPEDGKLPPLPHAVETFRGSTAASVPLVPQPQPSSTAPRADRDLEVTTAPANKTSARQYIRGTRGGCYYINSKGSKSYVDHSLCQ